MSHDSNDKEDFKHNVKEDEASDWMVGITTTKNVPISKKNSERGVGDGNEDNNGPCRNSLKTKKSSGLVGDVLDSTVDKEEGHEESPKNLLVSNCGIHDNSDSEEREMEFQQDDEGERPVAMAGNKKRKHAPKNSNGSTSFLFDESEDSDSKSQKEKSDEEEGNKKRKNVPKNLGGSNQGIANENEDSENRSGIENENEDSENSRGEDNEHSRVVDFEDSFSENRNEDREEHGSGGEPDNEQRSGEEASHDSWLSDPFSSNERDDLWIVDKEKPENQNDCNIIRLAIWTEIWKVSMPRLMFKKCKINSTASKFLMYRLEQLEKDGKRQQEACEYHPTALTLEKCSFLGDDESNASSKTTARLFCTFMKQNKSHWNRITLKKMSWRSIVPLCQTIANFGSNALDTLELAYMTLPDAELGAALKAIFESPECELSTVKLNVCRIYQAVWEPLMEGVRNYSKLLSLQICDCAIVKGSASPRDISHVQEEGLQLLMAVGLSQSGAYLKSLELSRRQAGNPGTFKSFSLKAESLPILSTILEQLPCLERLNLSYHMDLLDDMSFESSVLDDDGRRRLLLIDSFINTLVNHENLRVLDLSHCGIGSDAAKLLFQALASNEKTSLLYLKVRDNPFDSMLVVDYIKTFKTLRKLYLPGLQDETQRPMFLKALWDNMILLDCRCQIGDSRRRKFAAIFRRNQMLERARSILTLPLGVWPRVLEMMPDKKDSTAMYAALQAGHPGVTGGDAERKLLAVHSPIASGLADLKTDWD